MNCAENSVVDPSCAKVEDMTCRIRLFVLFHSWLALASAAHSITLQEDSTDSILQYSTCVTALAIAALLLYAGVCMLPPLLCARLPGSA